jgi:hypothetical protein
MMRETDLPEEAETVILDANTEVYLRHREDPVRVLCTFCFNREHLENDDPVESFMGIVTSTIRNAINDRTKPLLILSDGAGNKTVLESSEVQGISVQAPSTNTILEAMEGAE